MVEVGGGSGGGFVDRGSEEGRRGDGGYGPLLGCGCPSLRLLLLI